MVRIGEVIGAMTDYYVGDARRVNHFLKVYGFAKSIGESEGLSKSEQHILEVAALTHDIGIKNSELKFGNAGGYHQQVEGPPEAEKAAERSRSRKKHYQQSMLAHSASPYLRQHSGYGLPDINRGGFHSKCL
jgi:HD superfamily phosphohydrolase YqeK